MNANNSIVLNFNNAAPVQSGLIFKKGDKGITFNLAIKGLDTTGMTAKIAFNRSNATSVEAALTGSGEAWTYTTLGNEFAIPGVVVADVKFYNNDETQRVSTASFILGVIGDTLDGLGGGTAGYSDELELLRGEMEEAADTLEAYIEAYGDRGPLNPRGDYDSDEEYTVCDVVYYNNTSWINRVSCTGEEPTTSSAYWQKMIDAASGGAQELNDLDDVSLSSPTDGQAMIYDGINQVWKNQAIPAGSATLAGLTDVDVTGVQNGQIIKYNSTTQKWEAANESGGGGASDLDDLSDVDLSSPTNGQVLTFNSVTNKWENQTNTAAGFKPYIITTAATGATVTYSKGGTSITATEVSAGTFKADLTDYGTWTVTATLNGQTATTTVNVTSVGEYTASATFFSATINVTTWPTDGSVRLFVGSLSWSTQVIATSATTSITVPEAGTYSVVAEAGGTNIKDTSVVITTDGQTESVDLSLAKISLSFADEFRGQIIQLSKTGYLYSFTAPAAGNSMLLYAPDSSSWFIQANYSSTTYTTTATTTVGSTVSASLALTPDGSTVLPVNDVPTWLSCCASTSGSTHTTLAQVLADSTELNALLQDQNANDYLVRCKDWCGVELVPQMTSNTTPSGVASASGEYSDYKAWKAFDGSTSTTWICANQSATTLTEYIQYAFTTPTIVKKIIITPYLPAATTWSHIELEGILNGSASTLLNMDVNISTDSLPITYDITNSIAYDAYKLTITANRSSGSSGYLVGVHELQFYSGTDNLCDSQTFMQAAGAYNVCADTLISDSDWLTAIWNSTDREQVLNYKNPIMTSNNTPSGVASASDEYSESQHQAWHAFDTLLDNEHSWYGRGNTAWLQYAFASAGKVKVLNINPAPSDNTIRTEALTSVEGGNSDSSLTTLDGTSHALTNLQWNTIFLPSNNSVYTICRMNFECVNSYGSVMIAEIQIYGRQDV